MRTIAITLAAMLAVALATSAFAQSFAQVCEGQGIPTRAEYESNVIAYADNFCALATYEPHKAARQFNSMIEVVRGQNNPNRLYWDRRVEPDDQYTFTQLLRPWMAEQNYAIKWLKAPTFGTVGELATFGFVANASEFEDLWAPTLTLRIEDRGLLYADRTTNARPLTRYYSAYFTFNGRRQTLGLDLEDDVWRWRFGRRTWDHMDASLLKFGIEGVLDCLEDPVVFASADIGPCNIAEERKGYDDEGSHNGVMSKDLQLQNSPLLDSPLPDSPLLE